MEILGSVINSQQFKKEEIEKIFEVADSLRKRSESKLLQGFLMASVFYEPSTRTRFSFEAAMKNLGGDVISTENAEEFSSAAKGESLEDSMRTISCYVDVIVLRYKKEGGAERAQKFSTVPIINAGDGPGQHPTQALLDLYTIKKSFGEIEGLKIAMVGDLLNGRTVRSLCYFIAKHYPNNELFFVSPGATKMKDDIKSYLDKHGVLWGELSVLDPILPQLNVIYQTRVQKERFEENPDLYDRVVAQSNNLIITKESLSQMKEDAIIMHPLPRKTEIAYHVDNDPRAVYFKQVENGLYIRMALLKMILLGY